MQGLGLRFAARHWVRCAAWVVFPVVLSAQQGAGVGEFFEGRTVLLKMDMPGTHQGVDVYPERPQSLDLKNYSNRIKQFGVAIRSGDSAIVTKVKVKDDSVEFQLAGGGYGTSGDDTDTSVHFTSSEKSGREKDLESRIKSESNPDVRRSLQRELDEARSYRERRDRHDREIAEQAAEIKKEAVQAKRLQGGSRFNLRLAKGESRAPVTSQWIMSSLANYVTFPSDNGAGSSSARVPESGRNEAVGLADSAFSLRKGLTREQVEAAYGQPSEVHESNQNGLKVVTCTYRGRDNSIRADFVNGVLVQYTVSSR